jgi:hypothetical protein
MDQREQNQWKQAAAEAAAGLVEDGMVVGLGSGSTAAFFVAALARRISLEGLRVSGLATSQETAEQARGLGIPLTSFSEQAQIDIVVDGADEIETGTLYLIKGRGGALLREKIVAAASRRMAVIADETKLVGRLGSIVSESIAASGPGLPALRNRWRKFHRRLRVWRDGKPRGSRAPSRSSRRRGRTRTLPRICLAGFCRRSRGSANSEEESGRLTAVGSNQIPRPGSSKLAFSS